MKIGSSIILTALLLTSCLNKNVSATNETYVTKKESVPLLIGGKQYRGQLGERVEVEEGSWRIPNDPINCTVEDIDRLFIMTLWVDPDNPKRIDSLENLDLLQNLKELRIRGENFDRVDFSPISSLSNLEILEIEGNITRLPDLSRLEQLKSIEIKKASLESLEGISGAEIERLYIQTTTGNTILKIIDMKVLEKLEGFWFEGNKIDLHGIEQLSSLKYIYLSFCEPFNIEGIGQLQNLEELTIKIINREPSITFLRNLPNLRYIHLQGNVLLKNIYHDYKPTQIIDISPLATLRKIKRINCDNLIIKNISALDILDIGYINLIGSRLFDDTEKSKHHLVFSVEVER